MWRVKWRWKCIEVSRERQTGLQHRPTHTERERERGREREREREGGKRERGREGEGERESHQPTWRSVQEGGEVPHNMRVVKAKENLQYKHTDVNGGLTSNLHVYANLYPDPDLTLSRTLTLILTVTSHLQSH